MTEYDIIVYPENVEVLWVKWHGGEKCPIHPMFRIEVQYRSGTKESGCYAGDYSWEHFTDDHDPEDDVVAYRIA